MIKVRKDVLLSLPRDLDEELDDFSYSTKSTKSDVVKDALNYYFDGVKIEISNIMAQRKGQKKCRRWH